MAANSFLTVDEFAEAVGRLKAPSRRPDGDERRREDFMSPLFSAWLGDRLEARLKSHPDWEKCEPVALGSWARGDLCPKSDIDLLFCGDEEAVRRLTQDFSRQGLKIRYRVPANPEDWTQGVLPFDVLALFSGVPLTTVAGEKHRTQLERIHGRGAGFRRELLKAMIEERKARAERYDSISNFLEPNLKYGPGGLRDLEQALVTWDLFPEKFEGPQHALDVLLYYKRLLLLVRQKLHLSQGAGDILSAPEQKPISDWLGFADPKDFMREIQKGVSRVSFYADWVVEQASRPAAVIKSVSNRRLAKISDLFRAIEEDPSTLMQNHVRRAADDLFRQIEGGPRTARMKVDHLIGKNLARFLDPAVPEEPMVALFRSRLIDHCVPEFRRIVGHVQHDQYHRFSVDAHILQALRELKRIRRNPKLAGRLADLVRGLNKKEWEVLAFGCLYHDIAKGRGGDHGIQGVEIALHDLGRFGVKAALAREVSWIVEEHLALSNAAFRENPRAPHTWRALADKGIRGRKLRVLAVFTIVDIRATNPEAWTAWKERLLHELVVQLERPETDSMITFTDALKSATEGRKLAGQRRDLLRMAESLDPFLVGSVPCQSLIQDLKVLAQSIGKKGDLATSLEPLVVRIRGGTQTWVRFHALEDRPGLFLRFVSGLVACGFSVRHASIHTDPVLGVYDWFEVKTQKEAAQIRRLLSSGALESSVERRYDVTFDAIEWVGTGHSVENHSAEKEWVVSFRGRDQSGALLEAARALFDEGVEVRWAKVHTWGRQIDDVFGVVSGRGGGGNGGSDGDGPDGLIARLRSRFGVVAERTT